MQEANGDGKGGDFIGVSSSNHFRQEKSTGGLGLKRGGDELGSFRTTAMYLLVTRKPLMIPGTSGCL